MSCTELVRSRKVSKTNGVFTMKMYRKEDIPVCTSAFQLKNRPSANAENAPYSSL